MFCSMCGKKVDDNFLFCPSCGNKVNNAPESVPQPVQTPVEIHTDFSITEYIQKYYLPLAPYAKMYFNGNIPPKKLSNAIKAYAPYVNPGNVLALCDNTLFDNAKNGMIFLQDCVYSCELGTKKQIFYNNILKAEADSSFVRVYFADGSAPQSFSIGGKTEAVVNLFNAIAKNAFGHVSDSLVTEPDAKPAVQSVAPPVAQPVVQPFAATPDFSVEEYIQKYYLPLAPYSKTYLKGNIPPQKLNNAIRAYAQVVNPDTVLALFDTTLFDSGKNGMIFLRDCVYSCEVGTKKQIFYNNILKAEADSSLIRLYFVDGSAPQSFAIGGRTEAVINLFNAIAKLVFGHETDAVVIEPEEKPVEEPVQKLIEEQPVMAATENHSNEDAEVESVPVQAEEECDVQKNLSDNNESEVVSLKEEISEEPENKDDKDSAESSTQTEEESEDVAEKPVIVLPEPNGHRVTDSFSVEDRTRIYEVASKISYLETAEQYSIYKLGKAIGSFATGVEAASVLFCGDFSLMRNFKRGVVFTDSKMIYKTIGHKLEIEYTNFAKLKVNGEHSLEVFFSSGGKFRLDYSDGWLASNAENLSAFILLMKELYKKYDLLKTDAPQTFGGKLKSIIETYRYSISDSEVSSMGNINPDKFNNARKKYAENAVYNQCILLVNNSVFGSAKSGIMITIWGIYSYNESKNICILFNDIESLEASKKEIVFTLKNGTKVTVASSIINEKSLGKFIKRILGFYADYIENHDKYSTENDEYDYYSLLTFTDKDVESLTFEEVEQQHKNGNPFASIELAKRYINGIGVEQNVYKGTEIYESTRYAVAYRMLGELYFAGDKVEKNTSKAEKYFLMASALGDMESNVSVANMYFLGINHSVDYSRAFGMYKSQADKVPSEKLPESLKHNLAVCYKYGYGCDADLKLAEKWFALIKDESNSARHMLADMYINFDGFEDKKELGISYLEELTERRYIPAVTMLGTLLFEGRVLEQDFEKAEELLAVAAGENDPEACYQYALLKIYGCENGEIPEEAFDYMKKAADANHINAERDLGVMYQFGIGTRRNIYEAKLSYEKAASHGDEYAKNWKDYTKKFFNEISVLNHVCDNESDESDGEELYLSKIDNPDKLKEIEGYGLNSFVAAYPSNEMVKFSGETHPAIKRKFNSVETHISHTGLSVHNMYQSGSVWQNFTKFNQRQAHGTAMEYAAHVDDIFHFKRAIWKGGDNETLGADRVSGFFKQQEIQSKCYSDHNAAYRDTFPNDMPLYKTQSGEPMVIEVNSDVYQDYYDRVAKTHGKEFADKYVKDSGLTKKQCENIAKFGKIDSIKYSAKEGLIAGRKAFLISSAVSFAVAKINGSDSEEALKQAVGAGVKSMGTAFVTTTVTSQLMKTTFVKNLNVPGKIANNSGVQKVLGRATADSRGAAAGASVSAKTAGNMIKSAAVSGAVTTLVLSSADIARVISGRMSKEQLAVNVVSTAAGVAAGSAGYYIGAACGSVVPVVGTFIGGFIGGAIATAAAEKVVRSGMTSVLGDDNEEMLEIFNGQLAEIAQEYMLSEDELEFVIDEVKASSLLTESGLRDIFAADNREGFCYKNITPFVTEVCELRNFVVLPDEEEYAEYIVLNEEDLVYVSDEQEDEQLS